MVSEVAGDWHPILQRWENLDAIFGAEVSIVRDDLLPFPLAGNKVRKVDAELAELSPAVDVVISNGGIDSNYCRTLAMFAARKGIHSHLVLHGESSVGECLSQKILTSLGATYDIGSAETIADRISQAERLYEAKGKTVAVLSGGGHSQAGARAFYHAGRAIFDEYHFDQVFVASGTGATQGGLVAAAEASSSKSQIIGISVAREAGRGKNPVAEAAAWAGSKNPSVHFLDDYRDGGYGRSSDHTLQAVEIAWKMGLPVDSTYTGKVFNAMLDCARKDKLKSSVLFWHTGGLMNWLSNSGT